MQAHYVAQADRPETWSPVVPELLCLPLRSVLPSTRENYTLQAAVLNLLTNYRDMMRYPEVALGDLAPNAADPWRLSANTHEVPGVSTKRQFAGVLQEL